MLARALRRVLRPAPLSSCGPSPSHPLPLATIETLEPVPSHSHRRASSYPPPPLARALRRVVRPAPPFLRPGPPSSCAPSPTHPLPCATATIETLEPSHRRGSSYLPPPPCAPLGVSTSGADPAGTSRSRSPTPPPSPRFAVSAYGSCTPFGVSTSGADPAGTSCSRSPTPPSTPPPSSCPPPSTPPPWSSPKLYTLSPPASPHQLLGGRDFLSQLRAAPAPWCPASWKTTRNYCSKAQNPQKRFGTNPFKLVWKDAWIYFGEEECPMLLVRVPNHQEELYKLLSYNAKEPQMLAEKGKVIIRSLILPVLHCHEQGLCLGSSLTMQNLMVSSFGTFKLKKISTTQLTEKDQKSDLIAVRNLIIQILRRRHGITGKLPYSLLGLMNKLSSSKEPTYTIKNDPGLLPATTYGLAFLKLHGLLMRDGLLESDKKAAVQILSKLPYQRSRDSWIHIAKANKLLASWLSTRTYTLDQRHQMHFGRNMFSHDLEKKKEAALLLGVQTADYIPQAVAVLHHHSYPKLLPTLQKELWEYYDQNKKLHVMESLEFEDLFPGVPSWVLNDGGIV